MKMKICTGRIAWNKNDVIRKVVLVCLIHEVMQRISHNCCACVNVSASRMQDNLKPKLHNSSVNLHWKKEKYNAVWHLTDWHTHVTGAMGNEKASSICDYGSKTYDNFNVNKYWKMWWQSIQTYAHPHTCTQTRTHTHTQTHTHTYKLKTHIFVLSHVHASEKVQAGALIKKKGWGKARTTFVTCSNLCAVWHGKGPSNLEKQQNKSASQV